MSEDLKKEMEKLRQEIAKLKEQIKELSPQEEKKRKYGIYIDVGNRVRDYVEDIMECVVEGIHGELEKSVLIGPRGVKIIKRGKPFIEETEFSLSKTAEIMNALSHEHRLKILKELMSGGKYINELQEKLSEITTSTLSSHLKVLEEVGLVVQEKVRGRYLITMPGRAAYKMAVRTVKFLDRGIME